jgi:hypothetical protein
MTFVVYSNFLLFHSIFLSDFCSNNILNDVDES